MGTVLGSEFHSLVLRVERGEILRGKGSGLGMSKAGPEKGSIAETQRVSSQCVCGKLERRAVT